MLCEKCNMRPANIHLQQMVNGQVREQHLCSECAGMGGMGAMLQNLLGTGGMNMIMMPMQDASAFMPIQNLGAFMPMPGVEEAGPEGGDNKRFEALGLHLPDFDDEREQPAQQEGPRLDEKERLKAQLDEAVEKEEYEKAAKLRDALRALDEEK